MISKLKNSAFVIACGLALFSCEKEELPVAPYVPGDAELNEIGMEEDYRNQLYFDLETNTIVHSNLKIEWDLAFHSSLDHIVLNTSKGMAVHHSNLSFEDLTSAENLDWSWDAHSGDLDSTAFGIIALNKLYVIDRGYSHLGIHQGYAKIVIDNFDLNSFEVTYGEVSSVTPLNLTINRDLTRNMSYFNFDNGQVIIAPEKEDYDLIFTQYTHVFTNPTTAYLVTGVLLNRYETEAALYEEKLFEEIVFSDVQDLPLSSSINVIGYDWKSYDLGSGLFTTYPEMNYILKTSEDRYYKLHFTSFYNELGLKGFPNIEFQEL